jgi:hypothetical protein
LFILGVLSLPHLDHYTTAQVADIPGKSVGDLTGQPICGTEVCSQALGFLAQRPSGLVSARLRPPLRLLVGTLPMAQR